MRFENDKTENDKPHKLRTNKTFFGECFDLSFFENPGKHLLTLIVSV